MGKLFGTDGIRGVVGEGLDCRLAFLAGQAAAVILSEEKHGRPRFTIGTDTRISSGMLECALAAGLCSCGADVLRLGVIPTPAVAYLTVQDGADAGIVVSASHNPFEHNGIKIFNGQGYKLSDGLEEKIEALILSNGPFPMKTGADIGRVIDGEADGRERYVKHLASTVPDGLDGLKIVVDCANGAASFTAGSLFSRFGLRADLIHCRPDGVNINRDCGSTHLESLCRTVREGGYDAGVAFDGDADRCLVVDEKGNPVDGDRIMAVCGADLLAEGRLPHRTIVATVMSNLGLHKFAERENIRLICTDVGDRNVLEKMREGGFAIGGEQSGHMIFLEHATTGDGELTALQFLHTLKKSGKTVSALTAGVPQFPQVLVNVPVPARKQEKDRILAAPELKEAVSRKESELAGNGRILVRASGTEALIRVMVEANNTDIANKCALDLANVIKMVEKQGAC